MMNVAEVERIVKDHKIITLSRIKEMFSVKDYDNFKILAKKLIKDDLIKSKKAFICLECHTTIGFEESSEFKTGMSVECEFCGAKFTLDRANMDIIFLP